jgi:tetratricopeptide (TPR) repeat protein
MTPTAQPPGPKTSARRFAWRLLRLFLLILIAAGLGIWYWYRLPTAPPPLPEVSLAGAESVVVAAVERAMQRVREEPRSAASWAFLGQVLLAHSFEEQAATCFANAERFDPKDPRWPYLRGITMATSDSDAALEHVRRAVALGSPDDSDSFYTRMQLGEMLLARGDFEEAEKIFLAVPAGFFNHPRVHFGLGRLAFQRNDLPAALEHLNHVRDEPSARKSTASFLARIYFQLGRTKEADEANQRYRLLSPDEPWEDPYLSECMQLGVGTQSKFEMVKALEEGGDVAQATRMLKVMTKENQGDLTQVTLGTSLLRQGKLNEAEKAFLQSLEKSPKRLRAHFLLSEVRITQGERFLAQTPPNKEAARERFLKAAESAREVLSIKSDHSYGRLNLGRALMYLGERARGIEELRTNLLLNQGSHLAHYVLGNALAEDGQDDEALKHLELAVELGPPADPRLADALKRQREKMTPKPN